ncbi:MAG: hypothetical protein KH282_08125 [Clostridiales bacterium]|nr:hypothetical protein [Clostridiales bacterium]
MKWIRVELIEPQQTGTDALGNPVTQDRCTGFSYARFTPWTEKDVALTGRTVTQNDRKLLVRSALVRLPACSRVIVEGETYAITEKQKLGRFTLFVIKRTKG